MMNGLSPAHCTWKHGSLTTHQLGGMTGPIVFNMHNGAPFSPLATPPWEGEELPSGLPGHIRGLRGMFPCLPFGISAVPHDADATWRVLGHDEPNPMHGPGANGLWDVVEASNQRIKLQFAYDDGFPFALSEQTISPEADRPAVTFSFSALPLVDLSWPFGFHLMLKWTEAMWLDPGSFALGLTYPGRLEPGLMRTQTGVTFKSLVEVPGPYGNIDLTTPDWNGPTEDVVMMCGVEGIMNIEYPLERRRLKISWDPSVLPGCLLWYSRFGLGEAPWNNRYTAIGIEPVAAAFDFLPQVSAAHNPINSTGTRTAITFHRAVPFSTTLRLEAFPL